MSKQRWRIRFARPAQRDLHHIRAYTRKHFGATQEAVYVKRIYAALRTLEKSPNPAGSKAHDELLPELRSLHITLGEKRGRHAIYYRPMPGQVIEVLRILHDVMDAVQHVTSGAK